MPNYAQLYNKYFNLQKEHILLKTKLSEKFNLCSELATPYYTINVHPHMGKST